MPVQFDLTALTHRRSAKFVLASLIAVVAVMLALFTARVWRSKPGSANNAAAEQAHAPALTQEPLGHLLIKLRQPFVPVADQSRLDAEEQHVAGVKARVDTLQVKQCSQEEPCSDQQQ